MDILEVNRNTLANLYEQFPNSFNGLSMNGKFLIYKDDEVDISDFNINDLLSGEIAFASSLSALSAEDTFRIIKLHTSLLLNKEKNEEKKDETEQKVELLKQENPLMANISVVKRSNGVGFTEYFNIVDSKGEDHLFENDRDVDILSIYEGLKIKKGSTPVTPDELIEAINRRLYRIILESARDLSESSEVSEDFANKMQQINDPYRTDKTVRVLGNEQSDIAVIANENDLATHQVVTFNKNQYGDVVTEAHAPNVSGTETLVTSETSANTIENENNVDGVTPSVSTLEKSDEEVAPTLISEAEFYRLLNSEGNLSAEDRKNIDLFYTYLSDMVLYEDYLLPELRAVLNRFRNYAFEAEFKDPQTVNNNQKEAAQKNHEFEEKKVQSELNNDPQKVKAEEQKLQLKYKPNDTDNNGSISALLIIGSIIVVAVILTIITISVIG